jgi:hypothetical protein
MATRAQREELDYVVPGDVFLFLVIINRKYGMDDYSSYRLIFYLDKKDEIYISL